MWNWFVCFGKVIINSYYPRTTWFSLTLNVQIIVSISVFFFLHFSTYPVTPQTLAFRTKWRRKEGNKEERLQCNKKTIMVFVCKEMSSPNESPARAYDASVFELQTSGRASISKDRIDETAAQKDKHIIRLVLIYSVQPEYAFVNHLGVSLLVSTRICFRKSPKSLSFNCRVGRRRKWNRSSCPLVWQRVLRTH